MSVYNGERWQNYEVVGGLSDKDTLSGPLGERVFSIAVAPAGSPNAGDVWIGTNLGLSRYSPVTDAWTYFTRAEGLASDQINAIAVDDKGSVYAGTACDGLCIADFKDGYKKWRTVGGPLRPTLAATGIGLPSALINNVLCAKDGSVWVATDFGLGMSRDRGRSWSYIRGADWIDKVNGLFGGPPKGWKPHDAPTLLEDYTTCLTEDATGGVWIGHRQQPWEVVDVGSGRRVAQGDTKVQDGKAFIDVDCFCRCLAILPDRSCLLTDYSEGIRRIEPPPVTGPLPAAGKVSPQPRNLPLLSSGIDSKFPLGAKGLSPAQLSAFTEKSQKSKAQLTKGDGLLLGEDWATKGDWVGRYGRQYAVLCAADAPLNHYIQVGYPYSVRGAIGPHASEGDGLRLWVHWPASDDPRVLWDPCLGHRRQAEWDDHGEGYPMPKDGPDIWAVVDVPEGVHKLSLYFFNKDGHVGPNRYRDFMVELRQWKTNFAEAESGEPLARARVSDFWGGTYKSFAVTGPSKFFVKVARNYSFNTILSSIMLDRLAGPTNPLDSVPLAWMGNLRYDPPSLPVTAAKLPADRRAAAPNPIASSSKYAPPSRAAQLLAYRSAYAQPAIQETELGNRRWNLELWTPSDREQFAGVMSDAWVKVQQMNPELAALAGK